MNYKDALKYQNGFINYEKTPPKSHAELNLERMRHGLVALEHPEKKFFPILITGTVGKGSTGFFLEQILKSARISCGFYHSPHIDTIRERIRVNGVMLSEKKWAAGITEIQKRLRVKPFPKKLGAPTYFEMLTLLAIWLYARGGVKIGIFEIGMGGRLDATNVLDAPLCVITKIDLDHQAFLGNTLAKIAAEKAGIIKNARFVVSAPQESSALAVLKETVLAARSRGLSPMAKLIMAKPVHFQPALTGNFQKQNAGNAACAAEILAEHFGFSISKKALRAGLSQKKWPGRFESLNWKRRALLLDAAHNPAGCSAVADAFMTETKKPAVLLFSALRDKDSAAMLAILSKMEIPVILTEVDHPRAKSLADLAAEAEAFFDKIIVTKNTRRAAELLEKMTPPGGRALVTGSFYLLSEVRKILGRGDIVSALATGTACKQRKKRGGRRTLGGAATIERRRDA
jgi:dihydrofolate synthase/folylpolyglutamate synthase